MVILIPILRKSEIVCLIVADCHYLGALLFLTLILNRYAKDLVKTMYGENGPDFGAASDGTVDDYKRQNLCLMVL